jgi:hypothetical protein
METEMKWIKIIRVRSFAPAMDEIMPPLITEINLINESAEQVEAFVMQHALYDGDLSLLVVWKDGQPPEKSRLGLMFADGLQQIGTVDHAVWIPAKAIGNCEG